MKPGSDISSTDHICKNCGYRFIGRFCNACGEKIYTEKDKSVSKLLKEGFHFITHVEGTFLNTLKTLLSKPGKFSQDYCNGIRKKYFKPIGFFLMLVILYLLFPMYQGLNVNIFYHTHHKFYGQYAMNKSIALMNEGDIGDERFAELFGYASEKASKFLLFILIPVMGLFSWLMSFKKRKYYFDNFIFSTEAISFFILFGALILAFIDTLMKKIFSLHLLSNNTAGIVIISVFTLYLIMAARRFFQFKWWYSIVYSLLFSLILILFLDYIYNFILFYVTIHLM